MVDYIHFLWAEMEIIPFTHFFHLDKDLDRARDKFWIKSLNGTLIELQMKTLCPPKIKFHAWVKKCHFGNFTRNRQIGWIGHALLGQPSISGCISFYQSSMI